MLEQLGVERLILVGAAIEGCIVQTAIDARERGFKTTILADACATTDPVLEQTALPNPDIEGTMVAVTPVPVPTSEECILKFAALAAIAAALLAPTALASTPTLTGTVGPGFTITLTQGGKKVTKLTHGTYTIKVSDKSNIHNFHLTGPGLNKTTSVGGTGTSTWKVTLKAGTYTFVCDPHATIMKGSFKVS